MLQEIPRTVAAPDSPQITAAEAEAMVRAVLRLFERWQVSDAEAREILGGLAPRTYARWKAGAPGRIDRDLATRLSLLMGIHKGLRFLFSDPERGYAWVKKPNLAFGGRTPVEIMAQGDIFSLARVRSYLDAERGGW
ncbi:MAG: MbcA/ParS/Xre antitoxin family protein [Aquamicrobium sp.]|uniref:antitoxin Xre/MbcA/ParS toxin-binding domain-containing protein n=1 Tax=Aquamicrobium sp. TaxID=1872579 RepID=UPI00349E6F11|nr:MbcA/ParS/Xre antitoxin family protein [Aquamicrobium sp.]